MHCLVCLALAQSNTRCDVLSSPWSSNDLKALHNSKQEWTSESIHETCIHQTAKRRQTCTHPGTISATHTCNAAIHGPWKHLMIGNQIQRASTTGFYWKVWENKWVLICDLNEEYVCVWRMEKGRLFQVTGPR